MVEYRLTDMEGKFADIIWESEPIKSSELVKICKVEFNWKKSTTYTMLKRLEDKKIFQNKNSIVSALIKREDFYAQQSKLFVEENFEGSLPRFLAAFTRSKKLSHKEIDELQRLIMEHKEE
ncbi:BlaI/MecI/CopY family transcriptional regulator [Maledivibacter halophilus]|uniref:Predicted transcriptional regulator n=1 Tax=Maledivibacter halophilus TaxID=36842 RepID=A0A1T5IA67_9FIRM|nr:BlaI/MecI/CopY family transcriptional regulator [Maledivibacter halophilus]SKC36061.1 Predicted transcriptional regulator [Maledivibacter halophilus]